MNNNDKITDIFTFNVRRLNKEKVMNQNVISQNKPFVLRVRVEALHCFTSKVTH